MDNEFVKTVKDRVESLENKYDQLSLENRELDIRLTAMEDKK